MCEAHLHRERVQVHPLRLVAAVAPDRWLKHEVARAAQRSAWHRAQPSLADLLELPLAHAAAAAQMADLHAQRRALLRLRLATSEVVEDAARQPLRVGPAIVTRLLDPFELGCHHAVVEALLRLLVEATLPLLDLSRRALTRRLERLVLRRELRLTTWHHWARGLPGGHERHAVVLRRLGRPEHRGLGGGLGAMLGGVRAARLAVRVHDLKGLLCRLPRLPLDLLLGLGVEHFVELLVQDAPLGRDGAHELDHVLRRRLDA